MTQPSPVGVRLADLRKRKGLSRYELVKRMRDLQPAEQAPKVALAWPLHVETGLIKSPGVDRLELAARALGEDVMSLISDKRSARRAGKAGRSP